MLLESTKEIEAEREVVTTEPGEAEWRQVDRRLREYTLHRSALDAAELFDLVRAEQMKIYVFFGYVTLYEYMERVLGYGPHAARERMRVARALVALPETTTALACGALTYSAVRELTRVAMPETAWLAAADGLVANQIERLVTEHRPGDRPDDPADPDLRPRVVRVELPQEVYALWRQARMVVATERGGEITDADFVETLCRAAIAPGSGASGPAHQIAYQQCQDCRRATQNAAGREIDVGPEVLERASCDARILGSLDATAPERATTTVTPRLREQVFARDHYRCTVPGCRSARNLEAHHIIEQARGGKHELSNLCLLCTGHHSALHGGLLTMQGLAPYQIEFRWVYGPPHPVRLAADAGKAMRVQRLEEILSESQAVPPSDLLPEPDAIGYPAASQVGRRPRRKRRTNHRTSCICRQIGLARDPERLAIVGLDPRIDQSAIEGVGDDRVARDIPGLARLSSGPGRTSSITPRERARRVRKLGSHQGDMVRR